MRSVVIILFSFLVCVALASAQTELTCIANTGVPPTIRASGVTELVGDLTITCTGGTPTLAGSPLPLYSLKLQAQSLVSTDNGSVVTSTTITPVNITSRQLSNDGSSEAILLVNEPHSLSNPTVPLLVCGDASAPATAGVCAIKGTGTGVKVYDGTANRPNVFQGKLVAADTLQWSNIPFDPPGPTGTIILRITNVRMNSSVVPLLATLVPSILLLTPTLGSASGNIVIPGSNTQAPSAQTVAFINQSITVTSDTRYMPVPLQQCQASNPFLLNNPGSASASYVGWVSVREGFQSSFKRKNFATNGIDASTYPSSGDNNQNVPGSNYPYPAESGFENLGPASDPSPNPPFNYGTTVSPTAAFPSALLNAGVANSGGRVALVFNSVPTGVSVFVPTTVKLTNQLTRATTGQAVLVAIDSNGTGAFVPVSSNGGSVANFGVNISGLAQVLTSAGSGLAVYEFLYADEKTPEQIDVPIVVSYTAGVPPTGVTTTVTVAPAPFGGSSAADSVSPIPRFNIAGADTFGPHPLFVMNPCSPSNSKITLTASTQTYTTADSVKFTATVTPVSTSVGRQVTFSWDGIPQDDVTIAADGTASITGGFNGFGAHTLTASYLTTLPENQTIYASKQVLVTSPLITVYSSSTPQTVRTGTTSVPLGLTLADSNGTPRSGVPVVFTAPASGASGTFSNGYTTITSTTISQGQAAVSFNANGILGSYVVTATTPNSGTATFLLTNTSVPATVTANARTTPQSALTDTMFTPLSVTVKDALGNPLPGISVAFSAPGPETAARLTNVPGGTLQSPSVLTNSAGVASTAFTANPAAGSYTATATVAGLTPVTFSLTNVAGPPVVRDQPASQTAQMLSRVFFLALPFEFPPPSVRWQVSVNGGPFTDIVYIGTPLIFYSVTLDMSGNRYRAIFTNSAGSTTSDAATLTVVPAIPVVSWPNPADIPFGTALTSTQLNATGSVAGTFTYTPAAGTILPVRNGQTLTVTFTPTDSVNYSAISKTVGINVLLSGAPAVVSLSKVSISAATQAFALQFSHPSGFTNLTVMNLLINTALDGRKGCYIAYVQQTNTVYLVNDGGDAGGPYAGALVLNGSATSIANSQCSITAAGSAAAGSGATLTLTLNTTFTSSFAGNKVIYAAARDTASNNSGWQIAGVHGVPSLQPTFPTPVSVAPASGSGNNATLTLLYQDATSALNFQTVWALVNGPLDGRAACYVAYYRPGNQLFLVPDNGDGTQATSMVLTGTNSLSNSQCTVSAGSPLPPVASTILPVVLNFTFKSGFSGLKVVWMAGQTLAGQTSPWQPLGVWRVQ